MTMAPVFSDEGDPLAGEIERGSGARGRRCLGAAAPLLCVRYDAARRERDHERRRQPKPWFHLHRLQHAIRRSLT